METGQSHSPSLLQVMMRRTKPTPLPVILGAVAFIGTLLNMLWLGLAAALPILDLVSGAAPAVLVVSLVVAGIALINRYRLIAAVALLGGFAPPAFSIGVELAALVRPLSLRTSETFKIVSMNVWSGNQSLARIESFIRSEQPDLLLLQEAARSNFEPLYQTLETIYPTVITNYPHCSTAIATTLTLIDHQPGETCALTVARLALPGEFGGGQTTVASVHLPNARHADAGPEAEVLEARMSAWPQAIVGGDFNAVPWSWRMRRLDAVQGVERWTRALPTWPAPLGHTPWLPLAVLPIDHILGPGDWRLVDVRRGPDIGSDHYPVIVELSLPSPARGGS